MHIQMYKIQRATCKYHTDPKYERRLSENDEGKDEHERRGRGEDGSYVAGLNLCECSYIHVVGGCPDQGKGNGQR